MAGTVAEFLFMFEVHALTVPRIILKDFKSSPLKFLVCLEQITSIFSVIFWALLYPKDIKKYFELIILTWITLRWCYSRRFLGQQYWRWYWNIFVTSRNNICSLRIVHGYLDFLCPAVIPFSPLSSLGFRTLLLNIKGSLTDHSKD